MAAGLGDFLFFDIVGNYLGQECHNRFHYRVTSITGLMGDYLTVMSEWLRDNVLNNIRALQVSTYTYGRIDSKNLTNNIDFASLPLATAGNIGATVATSLPSNITMSFKLNRESLITRNGWKRFSGGYEENLDGNAWTLSGAPITNVQNALAADIVLGIATIAEPVVIKTPYVVPLVTTHPYASIGSSTFRTNCGTQNSRKPGVGV